MKELIPFKKDIIFKSKIAKITDISLTHDYKVLDNVIEGEFLLAGSYKMTEASVLNEEFLYNIPFSIAIGERINKDTINLELEDFKYEIKGDVLTINVDLNMNCEEVLEEREVQNVIEDLIEVEQESNTENIVGDVNNVNISIVDNELDINQNIEETKESIMSITNKFRDSNESVKYKVYIVRENDTIDNIASKYNLSIKDLMDYNDVEIVSIGDKIVIPYIHNES